MRINRHREKERWRERKRKMEERAEDTGAQ